MPAPRKRVPKRKVPKRQYYPTHKAAVTVTGQPRPTLKFPTTIVKSRGKTLFRCHLLAAR